jgi:hypothetical protein
MKRVGISSVCVLLVLLGACSNKASTTRTEQPTTSARATPAPTPCALEGGETKPREGKSTQVGPVIDVRPNAEACPRVVFEFKDAVPGYDIAYKDGPFTDCGSGAEVSTSSWDASAFIDVRLEPSGGPDLAGNGEPYYKGPRDIAVDGDVLKHLKVICDFEGVFEWVIGLDAKHPFDVTTFEGPPRLVIDISEA